MPFTLKPPLSARDRAFRAKLDRMKREDAGVPVDNRAEAVMVEIAGHEVNSTAGAVLWFDGVRHAWIARSLSRPGDTEKTIFIPEWLAKKVGFL